MQIAVDTHALIWYLRDSPRLSDAAGTALDDANRIGGILVPAGVLFDLVYLAKKGKLGVDAIGEVRSAIADTSQPISFVPVTMAIMAKFSESSLECFGDPWDRLIVATVQVHGVRLITRDEAIRDSQLVQTIW